MSKGAKLLSPDPGVMGQLPFLARAKEESMLVSLCTRALNVVHLALPIVCDPAC